MHVYFANFAYQYTQIFSKFSPKQDQIELKRLCGVKTMALVWLILRAVVGV